MSFVTQETVKLTQNGANYKNWNMLLINIIYCKNITKLTKFRQFSRIKSSKSKKIVN